MKCSLKSMLALKCSELLSEHFVSQHECVQVTNRKLCVPSEYINWCTSYEYNLCLMRNGINTWQALKCQPDSKQRCTKSSFIYGSDTLRLCFSSYFYFQSVFLFIFIFCKEEEEGEGDEDEVRQVKCRQRCVSWWLKGAAGAARRSWYFYINIWGKSASGWFFYLWHTSVIKDTSWDKNTSNVG